VGEREHRQPVPARPELRPVARRSMAHAGGRQGRERDPPGRPEPERASAAAPGTGRGERLCRRHAACDPAPRRSGPAARRPVATRSRIGARHAPAPSRWRRARSRLPTRSNGVDEPLRRRRAREAAHPP
jgi:hypothetical protein